MIGAPLSENYRIAHSKPAELVSMDGLEEFLGGGWKGLSMAFEKDNKLQKSLTLKDEPVSSYTFISNFFNWNRWCVNENY